MVCEINPPKRGKGRPKVDPSQLSQHPDAVRMREWRARRIARKSAVPALQRSLDQEREYRRNYNKQRRERERASDDKTVLHAAQNRRCGFEEKHDRDMSRLRAEIAVACERFWAKRGMLEPRENWLTNDFVFGRGATAQDGGVKARRALRKEARLDDAAREIEEAA